MEFDAIRNRTTATVTTNGNTATSTLVPNALNQLTARTVPGTLHVRGHVAGNATGVQVRKFDGPWIDGRPITNGDFGATVPLDNSAGITATLVEVKTTTSSPETEVIQSRRAILPPANEAITHDADGNMTSDGLKARTSVNIWHRVNGRIYCDGNNGYIETELSGSSFPSHRLWLMGELRKTIHQGPLANLWEPMPGEPTFVK